MEEMLYVRTKNVVACGHMFTTVHFHLAVRSYFSFSHQRYKIFMLFFQRTSASLFFISLSRSSSFSVIYVSVDLKI